MQNVLVDGGYTGKVSLGSWEPVEVVKRNELHTFVVLPKRWVVAAGSGRTANEYNTSLQMAG